jgi:hypothetical protein
VNRRVVYLAIAVVTMVVGLVWRFVPMRMPPGLYKYGGSVLWAAMIYWLTALVRPDAKPVRLALVAVVIATLVELFKLVHTPGLDAFRLTFVGKVVLGRFFYWSDFVAYYASIAVVCWADRWIRRGRLDR